MQACASSWSWGRARAACTFPERGLAASCTEVVHSACARVRVSERVHAACGIESCIVLARAHIMLHALNRGCTLLLSGVH